MIIEYHRPETLGEALNLLARTEPVTAPLGGGTVLSQKRKPDFAVVDLQKLGLNHIQEDGQILTVGAAATLQAIAEYPGLPDTIRAALVKSLQYECSVNIRRTATVAGALISCDGRSAFACALLALDARLVWAPGEETQALGDFLPLREPFGRERLMLGALFALNCDLQIEIAARTPLDRPIVCAAVCRWPAGRTRVALAGYGSAPVLAMDGPEHVGAAAAARGAYRFASDQWASAEYRSDVAGKLVHRILSQAAKASQHHGGSDEP